ncbi:hypothetical protein ACLOJK_034255 [Asimina triloba]
MDGEAIVRCLRTSGLIDGAGLLQKTEMELDRGQKQMGLDRSWPSSSGGGCGRLARDRGHRIVAGPRDGRELLAKICGWWSSCLPMGSCATGSWDRWIERDGWTILARSGGGLLNRRGRALLHQRSPLVAALVCSEKATGGGRRLLDWGR